MAKKAPRRATRAAQRQSQPQRAPRTIMVAAQYDEDELQDDEDEDEDLIDSEDDGEQEFVDGDIGESDLPEEYTADDYLAGQLLPLPSGKAVRIQPVSLLSMIQAKQVPNELLPAARKMVGLDEPIKSNAAKARMTDDTIQVMNFLVCELVTSFKVVDKPQSQCGVGEVSVTRMYEADKNAIVSFAMRGQRALRPFR